MSNKSKSTTFLLCFFFGGLGVHRFYLGKLITGILMLLTGGGLMIWWLVDLYRIITGRLKDKQGNDLSRSPPRADQPNAGFWVRLSALMVDGFILGLIQIGFIYLPVMAYLYNTGIFTAPDPLMALMAVAPILTLAQTAVLILYVGYFVALTAGKDQGTYGKRSMGIYVRKRDGGRVWIGHSLVRFVGYIISWIPLGLGYLMAAFHKNKLALHDLIAGTEVVYGTPSEQAASVDREAVTEVARPEPTPMPLGLDEVRPSRVPEILVGTGLLLITGAMALAYMR
ncbi:MAG: hypothetical protein BMS9Abin01_2414 [Gammaproteobacteria bacterium]|nr:MAG: hypothetical protein BMS9Abin01_2414 [Gammaproteobacteria bacterium]